MLLIDHPRDHREQRRGKTIILDMGPDMYGWTGSHGLSDLLEAAGHYIDAAKIWALNAATMPESYLKHAIGQYTNAGVETFAGGLLFEYAYLKNEFDGLVERLKYLGLRGIEVSENYITLNDNERLDYISRLTDAGLDVVFEFGRKYPDTPMELAELEAVVDRVTKAGAHHLILEQGEFDLLEAERPGDMEMLKKAPWMDIVFVEVDSGSFPDQHVALIERFGVEVNMANVAPSHVIRLENLRRGLGRPIDFPFFHGLVESR